MIQRCQLAKRKAAELETVAEAEACNGDDDIAKRKRVERDVCRFVRVL